MAHDVTAARHRGRAANLGKAHRFGGAPAPDDFVVKCAETRLARRGARALDRVMNADVAELADPAVLSRLLAQRSSAAQRGRVAVAFVCGTRRRDGQRRATRRATASSPLGCLAKLFTATLVRRAAERGRLALDGEVAPLLGARLRGAARRDACGTCSSTRTVSTTRCSRRRATSAASSIAASSCRASPRSNASRAPGAVYSYGHARRLARRRGSRATCTAAPSAPLVRDGLLEPLGDRRRVVDSAGAHGSAPRRAQAWR